MYLFGVMGLIWSFLDYYNSSHLVSHQVCLTVKSDEVNNLIDIQISDTHTQIFPFSILSFTNHFLNVQILKAFLFTLLFWFFLLFNRKFSTFCLLYADCSAIQKCDKSLWNASQWNIRIEGLSLSYLMTLLIL